MEALLPLIMNGAGGAILGPIISKVLGGKGATGLLGGLVGGVAGGYGMDAAGLLNGGEGMMTHVMGFLQGGAGGGIAGGLLGLLTKARG